MPAQPASVLLRGDFPSRVVAFILNVVSAVFTGHMNRHNWGFESGFKAPFALNIVATVLTLVGAAVSFNVWRVNSSWCPKRASSLVVLGLAAAGCSAACAALIAQVELGYDSSFQSVALGMQISAAILEFLTAVFVIAQFFGLGRRRQGHAVPAKTQRVSGESV